MTSIFLASLKGLKSMESLVAEGDDDDEEEEERREVLTAVKGTRLGVTKA